jgi:hypothetical protein
MRDIFFARERIVSHTFKNHRYDHTPAKRWVEVTDGCDARRLFYKAEPADPWEAGHS